MLNFANMNKQPAASEADTKLEFVVLGVLLAKPALMDAVKPSDFAVPALASVVERVQGFLSDRTNTTAAQSAADALSKMLGVLWESGETRSDGLLRTLRGNAKRRRMDSELYKLHLAAKRAPVSVTARKLRELLAEMEDDPGLRDDVPAATTVSGTDTP